MFKKVLQIALLAMQRLHKGLDKQAPIHREPEISCPLFSASLHKHK